MILVTGTSGFIGKHLLKRLLEKYGTDEILALSSVPVDFCKYLFHNNYKFSDDYFTRNGYDNIEIIIHAGAYTPKSNVEADNWEKCNSNVTNTISLLSASFPALKTVIYLSTLDIYSNVEGLISETSKIEPGSYYGESKYFGEKIVQFYCAGKGIGNQILRIGHVYGPGEENYKKLIPTTFSKIRSKKNIEIWGSGEDLRSFIYIDDVVSAIINSIQLKNDVGPINIVSGKAYTIREIVNSMVKVSGMDVVVENISTNAPRRDLVFDNSLMKKYLQQNELPLNLGLVYEWNYMMNIDEDSI